MKIAFQNTILEREGTIRKIFEVRRQSEAATPLWMDLDQKRRNSSKKMQSRSFADKCVPKLELGNEGG